MTLRWSVALVASALLLDPGSLAGQVDFVEVAELLDAGWKPSSRGLEAAGEKYDELQARANGDPRITYAYALVQMRNRRYDDARRLLDEVLKADKDHRAARRAKVWLLAVTKNYAAALVELETLVKSMPRDDADAEAQAEYDRIAEFAGRVVGFVDGPGAASLAPHLRADARKRVLAALPPTRQPAFERGNEAILKQFAELDLDRRQSKEDAKADAEERQARVRDQLERERAAIAQERGALKARSDKLAAELDKELADLDAKLRPLATRQNRLEGQAAAIQREMASIQVEIGRLLELADLAESPIEAARLRAEARRLDQALGRYDIDLRGINRDLAGIASERVALEGRRRAAIARKQAENDRIERRAIELRNTEKRIAGDEKRVNQPISGNTGAVASLAAKAGAFTSYEEFPFEEERAKLLQSFRE